VRTAVSRPEAGLRRLLTIGHSYVVAQNRRLAHEMAVEGAGAWQVTAAAPARLQGDLREITFEPIPGEVCDTLPIAMRLGGHPHLRFYGGALRPLLRQQWDVVHCWEEPYVLAAAQVAHWTPPAARFVPATFQNIAKRYPFPVAAIERRVMRRANAWIAFGETVHETQRARADYGAKPSRVINPGVDTAAFRPDHNGGRRVRQSLGWGPDDSVVGFTGRLVEEKGVETLAEALVRSTCPWKLLFVGGGRMQPLIDTLRLRYPSRVRLVTGVAHDDMPAYLNAMDLLCAPSRTTPRWREQFGRMLIEAMACGVPILASAGGEIPYVIGEAGTLLPEADVTAWRQEIERLLSDRARRTVMSQQGRQRAADRFAWRAIARAHLDFFTEICER
jgi:glycosyltransferase involved in cell wall biosynthesis